MGLENAEVRSEGGHNKLVIREKSIEVKFISGLRDTNTLVNIVMRNGYQLRGYISDFNEKVVLVEDGDGDTKMVYFDAVSTISKFRGETKRRNRNYGDSDSSEENKKIISEFRKTTSVFSSDDKESGDI